MSLKMFDRLQIKYLGIIMYLGIIILELGENVFC